ncbi:hypothetical protein [Nocardia sp. NPDC058666]
MGSTDLMAWISEGMLAGDPVRSALFRVLYLPIMMLGLLSGQPF